MPEKPLRRPPVHRGVRRSPTTPLCRPACPRLSQRAHANTGHPMTTTPPTGPRISSLDNRLYRHTGPPRLDVSDQHLRRHTGPPRMQPIPIARPSPVWVAHLTSHHISLTPDPAPPGGSTLDDHRMVHWLPRLPLCPRRGISAGPPAALHAHRGMPALQPRGFPTTCLPTSGPAPAGGGGPLGRPATEDWQCWQPAA
jgi:hypothetical protein